MKQIDRIMKKEVPGYGYIAKGAARIERAHNLEKRVEKLEGWQ